MLPGAAAPEPPLPGATPEPPLPGAALAPEPLPALPDDREGVKDTGVAAPEGGGSLPVEWPPEGGGSDEGGEAE